MTPPEESDPTLGIVTSANPVVDPATGVLLKILAAIALKVRWPALSMLKGVDAVPAAEV
jgi:hypothetical protein